MKKMLIVPRALALSALAEAIRQGRSGTDAAGAAVGREVVRRE